MDGLGGEPSDNDRRRSERETMKLSEQLKQDHECGDFGKALAGYADRAALLEDAVAAMAEDGWLYYGPEGMSDAQKKCYAAYLTIKPPNLNSTTPDVG